MPILTPQQTLDKIGAIVVGERSAEEFGDFVKKNGQPFIISDCRLCDEPVWATQRGYNGRDPGNSNEYMSKGTKAVHKDCILFFSATVINGMRRNLEGRGEL